MIRTYQGKYGGEIKFREGIDMPYSDFLNTYKNTYPFRTMPDVFREEEIKKAFKIATDGNIKPSPKSEPKIDKPDPVKPNVQDDKGDRKGDNKAEPESDI